MIKTAPFLYSTSYKMCIRSSTTYLVSGNVVVDITCTRNAYKNHERVRTPARGWRIMYLTLLYGGNILLSLSFHGSLLFADKKKYYQVAEMMISRRSQRHLLLSMLVNEERFVFNPFPHLKCKAFTAVGERQKGLLHDPGSELRRRQELE